MKTRNMMRLNYISKALIFIIIIMLWSCANNSSTEKFQKKRNEIINVHNGITEIEIKEVLVGAINRVFLLNDYLIIADHLSLDYQIHIFDKNDFKYLASTAIRGEGPEEITVLGHIGTDEKKNIFYVSDHGKQKIFTYELDSILVNPYYVHTEKMKMDPLSFPDRYQYINDTLCIGLIIQPINASDYNPIVSEWNMISGRIQTMDYENPAIEKKRISFAASIKDSIYIECHSRYDLMTICNINGQLKYNIYGPNWSKGMGNIEYYNKVSICNDKIIALYSGNNPFVNDENRGVKSNLPTKFLFFNLDGSYIQTLETDYAISDYCYDKDKKRIILSLDDEIQFAYLDLKGLI